MSVPGTRFARAARIALERRIREVEAQVRETVATRVQVGIFREAGRYPRKGEGYPSRPGRVAAYYELTRGRRRRIFFRTAMIAARPAILAEITRHMRPDFSIDDAGLRAAGEVLAGMIRANITLQKLIATGRLRRSVQVRIRRY
ncbi:MAG: hypothetical protein OXF01_08885 [Gemmatimonadetes bacterium]|nr:hypothetical protein [Gemmatimonadota bacterium]